MADKSKMLMVVKKGLLFPDFSIFKVLNKIYWSFVFNFFILRKLKKLIGKARNIGDILVIGDYTVKSRFEKFNVEFKLFEDYVDEGKRLAFKPYEEYTEAISLAKKWFSSKVLREFFEYFGYDLGEILEEEFSYFLVEVLKEINVLDEVIEKERPGEVFILDKKSLFGRACLLLCEGKEIKVSGMFPEIVSKVRMYVEEFVKRNSLNVRFISVPGVKRKEFVRTDYKAGGEGKILVGGFDEYYLDRLFPLIMELKKKGKDLLVLATNIPAQERLKKFGVEHASFGDFLGKDGMRKVAGKRKEAMRLWKKLRKDKEFRDLFDYGELNLWNLVWEELFYFFVVRLTWIGYYIESMERLCEKVKMAVLFDTAIPVDRAISAVCRKRGKKILVLQNGILADPTGRGTVPLLADKIAIWGKLVGEYFKKLKVGPRSLSITGNIQFDKYNLKSAFGSSSNLDSGSGSASKGDVLLALQAFSGASARKEEEKLCRAAIAAIKEFPDRKLIIKVHPRDETVVPDSIVDELKVENVSVVKDENVDDLLKKCEALITTNSTLLLDAMIIGKPVIILNLIGRAEIIPYVKKGAAIGVYKAEKLVSAIKLLEDEKVLERLRENGKKFLYDYCGKIDGKASERVVELIKGMIKDGK